MLQKNHHFLFPQTYFGSIEDFEEELFEATEDEEEEFSHVPWILILESNKPLHSDIKIGLFIHWVDYLES